MSVLDVLRHARSVAGFVRFGGLARRNPGLFALAVCVGLAVAGGFPLGSAVLGACILGAFGFLVSRSYRASRTGLARHWHGGGPVRGRARRGD